MRRTDRRRVELYGDGGATRLDDAQNAQQLAATGAGDEGGQFHDGQKPRPSVFLVGGEAETATFVHIRSRGLA